MALLEPCRSRTHDPIRTVSIPHARPYPNRVDPARTTLCDVANQVLRRNRQLHSELARVHTRAESLQVKSVLQLVEPELFLVLLFSYSHRLKGLRVR